MAPQALSVQELFSCGQGSEAAGVSRHHFISAPTLRAPLRFAAPQPLLLSINVPAQRLTNERAPRASDATAVAVDLGEKRGFHTQRDADHAAHIATVTPQRYVTVTISAQFIATWLPAGCSGASPGRRPPLTVMSLSHGRTQRLHRAAHGEFVRCLPRARWDSRRAHKCRRESS